jgi:hypothetical protein
MLCVQIQDVTKLMRIRTASRDRSRTAKIGGLEKKLPFRLVVEQSRTSHAIIVASNFFSANDKFIGMREF